MLGAWGPGTVELLLVNSKFCQTSYELEGVQGVFLSAVVVTLTLAD